MFILASNSWLRKTILDKSGIKYSVRVAKIDERKLELKYKLKSHEETVLLLALKKANYVAKKYPNDLVVAADTFAILPSGERLHKPQTTNEAIDICMKQSGKRIKVLTGIAMIYKGIIFNDLSETFIKYSKFSEEEIKNLLKGDSPIIRNAALGFFLDAPGFTLVSEFHGSYTGAMGLPMDILRMNLKRLNYKYFNI